MHHHRTGQSCPGSPASTSASDANNYVWTLVEREKFGLAEAQGMMCEYYRPFEITFDEALGADEYPKLKKKMEKKLEEVRGKD